MPDCLGRPNTVIRVLINFESENQTDKSPPNIPGFAEDGRHKQGKEGLAASSSRKW